MSDVVANARPRCVRSMRLIRHGLFLFVLSNAANAAPVGPCVVVRKPTAQQREESAADVERLLDDYEAKTGDNTAWPNALAEVFDRFPLPSVNMLMALHHPAWGSPEKKLLAYVEAIRQSPLDYADPAAVAQTIKRIRQELLAEVQRRPLLIVEARGVVRQKELAKLDIRIGDQACTGNATTVGVDYSVSWVDRGRRLTARVAPHRLVDGEDWCIAIDRDAIGPCDGELSPGAAPDAAPAPRQTSTLAKKRRSPNPSGPATSLTNSPTLDYALAVPGLALAATGLGLAIYARDQVNVHMDRAEGGSVPRCHDGQCSQSGMKEVLVAKNWQTAYYVAGTAGLLGVGTLLAAGHRYYAEWLFPSIKQVDKAASLRTPRITPIATMRGASLLIESRF